MEIGGTMREILFRGKRVDNGEWVYGYFWSNDVGNSFIRVTKENDEIVLKDYEVSPETVGEYTGLTDKNGNRIFEGDIVKLFNEYVAVIIFENARLLVKYEGYNLQFSLEDSPNIEVIGTIHDNPELLEDNRIWGNGKENE